MVAKPIVIVSSYPPRLCGIATFTEEAREFIQKAHPERDVLVISHLDGRGDGVFPIIDLKNPEWWEVVALKIRELDPYVVHLEHEYGLYEYRDTSGRGDNNEGFLRLLDALRQYPTVAEPHTVHGRLKDHEAYFMRGLCQLTDVVLFKCHYQRWRLDWNFTSYGWEVSRNIMVVPHGARPDRRWGPEDVRRLKQELGLARAGVADHIVGMIGWIQSNKRWDILLSMWEDVRREIMEKCGTEWDLLAAGTVRDEAHLKDYQEWKRETLHLEDKGIAHYYEFIPRGDLYYKIMAVCDFVVIPSIDETQSGTLARVIALNKPFITTAPLEGLTAQTLESEGGLLFTTKRMLKEKIVRLACDENLRLRLGDNLKRYLENEVSWEVVAKQYSEAYRLANEAKRSGKSVVIDPEF